MPSIAQASDTPVTTRLAVVTTDQIIPLSPPKTILEIPVEDLDEYKEVELAESPSKVKPSFSIFPLLQSFLIWVPSEEAYMVSQIGRASVLY